MVIQATLISLAIGLAIAVLDELEAAPPNELSTANPVRVIPPIWPGRWEGGYFEPDRYEWSDAYARRWVSSLLDRARWVGAIDQPTQDFLLATAYTESRWRPWAAVDGWGPNNKARGLWQLFPSSYYDQRGDKTPEQLAALTDPRNQLMAAIAFGRRLRANRAAGDLTAIEARCGWWSPSSASDDQLVKCRTDRPELFDRWAKAKSAAGVGNIDQMRVFERRPDYEKLWKALTP